MTTRSGTRLRLAGLVSALLAVGLATAGNPADAIVGGSAAPQFGYPYAVSVQRDGNHFCGGSVIAQQWVLTAAHCVPSGNPAGLTVVVGNADYTLGRRIAVAGVAVHPGYDQQSIANDAALLRLAAPANVPAVALATAAHEGLEADGTPVVVVGWGWQLPIIGLPTNYLKQAELQVVGDGSCAPNDPATMVCAAALLRDSCQGDSGGPLVYTRGGAHVQIGIVSHGFQCAIPGFPGVYGEVNAPSIRNWITATAV